MEGIRRGGKEEVGRDVKKGGEGGIEACQKRRMGVGGGW